MAGPTVEVEPPVRVPREGGLSTVATYRQNQRLAASDALVFQSDGCTFPRETVIACIDDTPATPKTFDGIAIDGAIGAPFALYGGVSCFAGPDDDYSAQARRILTDGRDRAAEEKLETWATGGTAVPSTGGVIGAIAEIEQALDNGYVGRGVILMSRADALRAAAGGAIEKTGDTLYTKLGTPVIASGAVASGTVYGLGAVVVEESPVNEYATINPQNNRRYALAEAAYAILVDCEFRIKSAVTV